MLPKISRPLQNSNGFTLMELMVAAFILGALLYMAMPAIDGYLARARQGEAKINLARVYGAERTFRGEWQTFSLCLDQAGLGQMKDDLGKYYTVGFMRPGATANCGMNSNQSCYLYRFGVTTASCTCSSTAVPTSSSDCTFVADKKANPSANMAVLSSYTWRASKNTFTAGAAGSVSGRTNKLDVWTIDQTKTLRNIQNGLQ